MKNEPQSTAIEGIECMKHRLRMSAEEARCRDPELYCKFRTSCLIHFLQREKTRSQHKG